MFGYLRYNAGMTTSGKVAVVLGVVCALLVGLLVGSRFQSAPEQERFFGRLNSDTDQKTIATFDRIRALEAAKVVIDAAVAGPNDRLVLPDASSFRDYVRPKVSGKDSAALNAFVWTFPGGDILHLESPATTEIGYVPFEGGRAIAYADGSVRASEVD